MNNPKPVCRTCGVAMEARAIECGTGHVWLVAGETPVVDGEAAWGRLTPGAQSRAETLKRVTNRWPWEHDHVAVTT